MSYSKAKKKKKIDKTAAQLERRKASLLCMIFYFGVEIIFFLSFKLSSRYKDGRIKLANDQTHSYLAILRNRSVSLFSALRWYISGASLDALIVLANLIAATVMFAARNTCRKQNWCTISNNSLFVLAGYSYWLLPLFLLFIQENA